MRDSGPGISGARLLRFVNMAIPAIVVGIVIASCGGGSDADEPVGDPGTAWPATPPPVDDTRPTDETSPDSTPPEPTEESKQIFDGSEVGFWVGFPNDWVVVDLIDSVPIDLGGQVVDVVVGSPAEGTILVGDIIGAIDGVPTNTMEAVREAIVSRRPGETLRFLVSRPDPDTLEFSTLEIMVTLAEHPDNDGPFLGIQFQNAAIRTEFQVLSGTLPPEEISAYMFGTTARDKLVAVDPSGRPAFSVSVGEAAEGTVIAGYDEIAADYMNFVRSIGGTITANESTTIDGRPALRILARQPTVISGLTTVFYISLRTDARLFTLQFFSLDPIGDAAAISDILSSFTVVE